MIRIEKEVKVSKSYAGESVVVTFTACTRASFGIISKLQDKYPQIYWDIRLDESIVSVF